MLIENPNLPKKPIKAVLIDYRAESAGRALESLGVRCYLTPKLNLAYKSITGHPDIFFHQLDDKNVIVAPETALYFKKLFPDLKIISGTKKIGGTYPFNIAYNVARINKVAFHKVKYTDNKILEYYNENGIKLIDIKQGYSKCSICVVAENAIITSDKKIAEKSLENGIDVLCIREGYIKLNGLSFGFIGGCSGLISKEILAINGNIRSHPEFNEIKNFCNKYNVAVYPLHNGVLEDIGSIIPLY